MGDGCDVRRVWRIFVSVREIRSEHNVCSRVRKYRSKNLMLMIGLNETTDQLAMASNVCFCGHVFWREDDHEKGSLKFR